MRNLYSIAAADCDAFIRGVSGSLIRHQPARPTLFDPTQQYAAVSHYQTPYGVVMIEYWGDIPGPWFGRHRVYALNVKMLHRIIADPLIQRDNDPVIDTDVLPFDMQLGGNQ